MTRKPKPIKERKEVDDDLQELAEVLDEHRLDQNAAGWFTVPWRVGYYAASLGLACFRENADKFHPFQSPREKEIYDWLAETLTTGQRYDHLYWQAGEFLQRIDLENVSQYLFAALRCFQVWVSNSDGGGEVYNYILKSAFDKTEPSHLLEDVVLEWRCRDALGVSSVLQSDHNDRKRRAFVIAWRRGLFHAAYSIAPVRSTTIAFRVSQ